VADNSTQHFPFSALTLLVVLQEGYPACKMFGCWLVVGDDLTARLYCSSCHHLSHP